MILNTIIIWIIQIRFQQKLVFPDSHRSDLEDSGVTSRRDLHGSQNLGESWKVSGTGSLTESSTQEKDDLNNKCDSANTWPWKKMFSGCFEDKEDKEKYFRSRPGSGRFSNMRFILENPTEVFTRAVTIYERNIGTHNTNHTIIWFEQYLENLCPALLFMIPRMIQCDVNTWVK